MAPIFEDGNNKKDRPREGDLFETRSPGTRLLVQNLFAAGREVGLEPDLDNLSIIENKYNFRENVLKKHFSPLSWSINME